MKGSMDVIKGYEVGVVQALEDWTWSELRKVDERGKKETEMRVMDV